MASKKTGTAVMSIKEQKAAALAQMKERITKPAGTKISTKGAKFTIPGQGQTTTLPCIILDFVAMNEFYEGAFDPKEPKPPVCAAKEAVPHDELIPVEHSPELQNEDCATCPQNEWGSDPKGGKGKACKNTYMLAVAAPGDDDTIYTLSVPAGSLKEFDGYRALLLSEELVLCEVVTMIEADPDLQYMSMYFEKENPISADDLPRYFGLMEKAQKMLSADINFDWGAKQEKPAPKRAAKKKAARKRAA